MDKPSSPPTYSKKLQQSGFSEKHRVYFYHTLKNSINLLSQNLCQQVAGLLIGFNTKLILECFYTSYSFSQEMNTSHFFRQNSRARSFSSGSIAEQTSEFMANCLRHFKSNPQAIKAA